MFPTKLLWQNDSRWAGNVLGYGPATIKEWGCLTTSLTMVVNGFGHHETPPTFSDKMKAAGGFQGAAVLPFKVPSAFSDVAFISMNEYVNDPAPMAQIDAALASNKPVIVRVDWSPNPGLQDHWVILSVKDGKDYLILDPYQYKGDAQGTKVYLTKRYHYSGSTPAEVITAVVLLDKASQAAPSAPPAKPVPASDPVTPPASGKVPLPANAVKLYPTSDQVAFRGAPALTAALLRRLPLNATLLSAEEKAATLSKVGQADQWLQVQAPEGDQGYVAAWYLSTDAAPPSAPAAQSTGGTLTVTTIDDQVAFRRQPVIADSNIIRRLPLGARLALIDPAAAQKIGVNGQWLQVKDEQGTTGYVAAWYVK